MTGRLPLYCSLNSSVLSATTTMSACFFALRSRFTWPRWKRSNVPPTYSFVFRGSATSRGRRRGARGSSGRLSADTGHVHTQSGRLSHDPRFRIAEPRDRAHGDAECRTTDSPRAVDDRFHRRVDVPAPEREDREVREVNYLHEEVTAPAPRARHQPDRAEAALKVARREP